jgi:hypothetical protein
MIRENNQVANQYFVDEHYENMPSKCRHHVCLDRDNELNESIEKTMDTTDVLLHESIKPSLRIFEKSSRSSLVNPAVLVFVFGLVKSIG